MKDLKLLLEYMLEHKIVIVVTMLAALAGAFTGALAFYNGWLG